MSRTPISERAHGKWHDVLTLVGIPRELLDKRHKPCPWCGGKDRFRWTDHNGSGAWICNQCGNGTGIDFVMRFHKIEFKEAAQRIEAVIGDASEAKPETVTKDARRAMRALWSAGVPITRDCAAGSYLERRGIVLEKYPPSLRYVSQALAASNVWSAAMIAKCVAGAQAVNVHKTFLDDVGSEPKKKLMHAPLPGGTVVMLGAAGETLGIAEGIETALSASKIFDMPVWAAINAGNLCKFVPPETVKNLWIFGDNDENFVGQSAAYALAKSLSKRVSVRVEIPGTPGNDWNDVLRQA